MRWYRRKIANISKQTENWLVTRVLNNWGSFPHREDLEAAISYDFLPRIKKDLMTVLVKEDPDFFAKIYRYVDPHFSYSAKSYLRLPEGQSVEEALLASEQMRRRAVREIGTDALFDAIAAYLVRLPGLRRLKEESHQLEPELERPEQSPIIILTFFYTSDLDARQSSRLDADLSSTLAKHYRDAVSLGEGGQERGGEGRDWISVEINDVDDPQEERLLVQDVIDLVTKTISIWTGLTSRDIEVEEEI